MRLYGTFNGTLVIAGLAIIFTLIAPSIFQFFRFLVFSQQTGRLPAARRPAGVLKQDKTEISSRLLGKTKNRKA